MRHHLAASAVILALLCASPLAAQSASADKESFVIEPPSLASGTQSATLRLISNTASGFVTSSAKAPTIAFSAGVTLTAGTFQMLNANEAECQVSVDADAFGVVQASISLYSVNGSTTSQTLRGTLGILGPAPLEDVDAEIRVESIELVQVNVTEDQAAGVIVLDGRLNGGISITAPTGTVFAQEPQVEIDAGDITMPGLSEGDSVFTFQIGNAPKADVLVRIVGISYDTSSFTTLGGVEGGLACLLSGAALENHEVLAVNAHTALTTVEGANDVVESSETSSSSSSGSSSSDDSSDSTTPTTATTTTSSASSEGSSREREDDERRERRRAAEEEEARRRNSGSQPSGSGTSSAGGGPKYTPLPAERGKTPGPVDRGGSSSGGARPVPSGGPSSDMGGGGRASWASGDEKPETSQPDGKTKAPETPPRLITTPGLYFCDKDFQPVDAVVLDRIVSGKAAARVWIVLKLKEDKNPGQVDTVDVTLRLGGTRRQIRLTETARNSGEFRCDEKGILLVSTQDPDSNRKEAEAKAPKPRLSTWK